MDMTTALFHSMHRGPGAATMKGLSASLCAKFIEIV